MSAERRGWTARNKMYALLRQSRRNAVNDCSASDDRVVHAFYPKTIEGLIGLVSAGYPLARNVEGAHKVDADGHAGAKKDEDRQWDIPTKCVGS